jgi:hypothetical protein
LQDQKILHTRLHLVLRALHPHDFGEVIAAPVPPWNFADIAAMVGTLITAIVDVLLNVAMGFISLFVAFVVAPTINAVIVAAIFLFVVGLAYLCRHLYYYLGPPPPIPLPAAPARCDPGLATCLGEPIPPKERQPSAKG